MTELINAEALAEKLQVTPRFVKEYSRASRTQDPIPHVRLHRRSRLYAWGSADLEAWLMRRGVGAGRRKA